MTARAKNENDNDNENNNTTVPTRDVSLRARSFHLFSQLPNELKLLALSFIAEIPSLNKSSTLTNVLPLVSHEFRRLSRSDCLWQTALERLIETEPSLWRVGLEKLCDSNCKQERQVLPPSSLSLSSRDLVLLVHTTMHSPGYFRLYRMIVARLFRFTAPVFYTSALQHNALELGRPFHLHLLESRRAKLLIQLVMEGFPMDARNGHAITTQELPFLVYAIETQRGCYYYLVEVHRCNVRQDGTAEVWLMPVSFVTVERMWTETIRHDTAVYKTCCFAQCVRCGSERLSDDGLESSIMAQQDAIAGDCQCLPCCIL